MAAQHKKRTSHLCLLAMALCLWCTVSFAQVTNLTVINPDFDLPGTGKIQCTTTEAWEAIPGWTGGPYEAPDGLRAGASGVENGGVGGSMRGFGNGHCGNMYQLLSDVIESGMVYTLEFAGRDVWRVETLTAEFYYQDASDPDNRIVIYGETYDVAGTAWTVRSISFQAVDGEAYIGKQLGIQFSGYGELNGGDPGKSWWGVDNVVVTKEFNYYAQNPTPSMDVMVESTDVDLTWIPGGAAQTQNVYMGTSPDELTLIAEGITDSNLVLNDLERGTTYYWRIDSINEDNADSPWVGEVWNFWVHPMNAHTPVPADETAYVLRTPTLNWDLGHDALLHYVYFGTDPEAVANATIADANATLPKDTTSYSPEGELEYNTTYYWRVDEFATTGITKGKIWSFTTVPSIPVEDERLAGWWKCDEINAGSIVDWSGHDLHAAINGEIEWVPGVANTAIQLDGVSYAMTPVPDVNTNTLTLTAWVMPDSPSNWSGLLYSRWGGLNGGLTIGVGNDLRYQWKGKNWDFESHLVLPNLEWSFVAVVIEPTQATLVLNELTSVNDQEVTHDPIAFGNGLSLGRDAQAANRRFIGAMDDMRMYTKALTTEELTEVMNAGTPPVKPVDPNMIEDFDGYRSYMAEPDPNVWDVWADGYGNPENGSTSGNLDPPFMERANTVAGGQALPFAYDNLNSVQSVINRSFDTAIDLSANGATELVLYLRGLSANQALEQDQLSMTLSDGSKTDTIVIAAPEALKKTSWQEIVVELSDLTINVSNVTEISFAIGSSDNQGVGGEGTIYLDDIQIR